MEVEIEYDYVQKPLMGNSGAIELEEDTTLAILFGMLDVRIVAAASEQGIEPDGITFLKSDGTCACMLQVNGKNPVGLLDYVLRDRVEVVFGFCGGVKGWLVRNHKSVTYLRLFFFTYTVWANHEINMGQ